MNTVSFECEVKVTFIFAVSPLVMLNSLLLVVSGDCDNLTSNNNDSRGGDNAQSEGGSWDFWEVEK